MGHVPAARDECRISDPHLRAHDLLGFGSTTQGCSTPERVPEFYRLCPDDKIRNRARADSTLEARLVSLSFSSENRSEPILIGHIESLRPSIERFAPTLGTIIAAAPLLGILGTVTGIIQSFDLLGEASTVSDPTVVAGGIAEALYTTAFGLCIALITLFPHVYFKSRADRALGRLEILAGAIASHSIKN